MKRALYLLCLIGLGFSLLAAALPTQARQTQAIVRVTGDYSSTYYGNFTDWNIFPVLLPILNSDPTLLYTQQYDLQPHEQIVGTLQGDTSNGHYQIDLPAVPNTEAWYDTDGDPATASKVKLFVVGIASGMVEETYVSRYDFIYTQSFAFDPNSRFWAGDLLAWSAQDNAILPVLPGGDHLYYTADDIRISVPSGWSEIVVGNQARDQTVRVVRDPQPDIRLYEPKGLEDVDLSQLSYADAFSQLIINLEKTYVFTSYRQVDWEALRQRFAAKALQVSNDLEFQSLLESALFTFYDGHLAIYGPGIPKWVRGSLGIQVFPVNGELMIINMLPDGPLASRPEIVPGTVITSVNGLDAMTFFQAVPRTVYSTGHEIESIWWRGQLAFRGEPGTVYSLDYRLPDGRVGKIKTATVSVSGFGNGGEQNAPPLTYEILGAHVGYIKIANFTSGRVDDLWDQAMAYLGAAKASGIIIDLRQNGGGFTTLANYMMGDFLDSDVYAGKQISTLDEDGNGQPDVNDEYYYGRARIFDPAKVTVLVGPECYSACEFAAQGFQDIGAKVVGNLPTAGAGGGVGATYILPGGTEVYGFAVVMATNPQGNIRIEGTGVRLDVSVPFTAQALASGQDTVLEAAVRLLTQS